jgi:hypothetical protein
MRSEEGADLLFIYALADRLSKTASEIVAMPTHEREGWLAYLKREADFRRAEQR